jgi:hypothetical protein
MPGGMITAIALLAALDLGISRSNRVHRDADSSIYEFLSTESQIKHRSPPPDIIILGNSRSKAGMSDSDFDDLLHLTPGSTMNLSVKSGDHYDNLLFYRRNIELLRNARILIYAVDAYQWNATTAFSYSDRFSHFASFQERWLLRRTPKSILGFFYRTIEEGPFYRTMIKKCFYTLKEGLLSGHTTTAVQSDPPPVLPVRPQNLHDRLDYWYKDFSVSQPQEQLLRRLIDMATGNGTTVVLVQLPFQDRYMDELLRTHRRDYHAYTNRLSTMNNVHAIVFEKASNCGLTEEDFQDWDHLKETSRRKMTRLLAEQLLIEIPEVMVRLQNADAQSK